MVFAPCKVCLDSAGVKNELFSVPVLRREGEIWDSHRGCQRKQPVEDVTALIENTEQRHSLRAARDGNVSKGLSSSTGAEGHGLGVLWAVPSPALFRCNRRAGLRKSWRGSHTAPSSQGWFAWHQRVVNPQPWTHGKATPP